MTGKITAQNRRFRFSLRALLMLPLAVAVFLVLFNPRIITGHFCYVTIDWLNVSDNGGFSVKYSRIATPGTIVSIRLPGSSGSGASSGGAFTWYLRGSGAASGGVNLNQLGLDASDWHRAVNVEAGKTYRVELGERLILYSLLDPATEIRHEGYIDFQKYPRR